MRFYDFMTWFWAALWGAASAAFVVFLAGGGREGIVFGLMAGVGMACLVAVIRYLRGPQ